MKRQIASILGVLGLLIVAACANAQTPNLKANVPFDFVVDKAAMPAGAYSLDALSHNTKAMAVRNREAGITQIVLPNTARSLNVSSDTKLVFHRYGDEYFLSQIWIQGEREGLQFNISRREAEMAQNSQSNDVVILAELR